MSITMKIVVTARPKNAKSSKSHAFRLLCLFLMAIIYAGGLVVRFDVLVACDEFVPPIIACNHERTDRARVWNETGFLELTGEWKREVKALRRKWTEMVINEDDDLSAANLTAAHVILRPTAELWDGPSKSGNRTEFNKDREARPKCLELKFKVLSIDTKGTCVRLSNRDDCVGTSRAFYPGSENKTIPPDIRSIGSCFDNELAPRFTITTGPAWLPSFQKKRSKLSANLLYIPDVVVIAPFVKPKFVAPLAKTSSRPIVSYELGHRNRVEFLRIEIISFNQTDLFVGFRLEETYNETEQNAYKEIDKYPSDEIGRFVTALLGEQTVNYPQELKNIFPQSRWNMEKQLKIERRIMSYLESPDRENYSGNNTADFWAMVYLDISYPNETTTRPSALNYFINYHDKNWEDFYVPNLYLE